MKNEEPLQRSSVFVGRNEEINTFNRFINNKYEQPLIFSICGSGGIGKTSLLDYYSGLGEQNHRLLIKVDLEDAKTKLDILSTICNYSKIAKFKKFQKGIKELTDIWSKVFKSSKNENHVLKSFIKDFTGAGLGGTLGLIVGGPLGLVMGASAGALSGVVLDKTLPENLKIFNSLGISEKDALFAMNPINSLTKAVVQDLNDLAKQTDIIIIMDNYERARDLDDWLRLKFIEGNPQLRKNITLFIESRDPLSIEWKKLNRQLIKIPLNPLLPQDVTELLFKMGISDEEIISFIIEESKCIPWLVELLAEAEIVSKNLPQDDKINTSSSHDLYVERLMNHLDEKQCRIIEAASCLRAFDQDILNATLDEKVDTSEYKKITNLSFIEIRRDQKWALTEVVRQEIEANVKNRSLERYNKYHESALEYFRLLFSKNITKVYIALEIIYHGLKRDSELGLDLACKIFDSACWPPNYVLCEAIVGEIRLSTSKGICPSGWSEYLQARLMYLKNQWIESKKILEHLGQDIELSSKLHALSFEQLGWIEFHQGNLKIALGILQKAHKINEQLNNTIGIDMTLNHLGRISRRLGQKQLAKAYHETVLKRTESSQISSQESIEAFRCLSRLWRDEGEWNKAVYNLENSLVQARKIGKRFDEALALTRLAELYVMQGRWHDAQISSQTGLDILETSDNDLALGGAYQNAGRIEMWLGNSDNSLTYYLNALLFYRKISAKTAITLVQIDLSRFFLLKESYKRAEDYADNAMKSIISIGEKRIEGICIFITAEIKRKKQDYNEAMSLYETSLQIFRENNDKYHIIQSLLGTIICLWKTSPKVPSNIIKEIENIISTSIYPDLIPKYNFIRGCIQYKSGKIKIGYKRYKGALEAAKSYSKLLYEDLLSDLKNLWGIYPSTKDDEYINHKDYCKPITNNSIKEYISLNISTGRITINEVKGIDLLQKDQHIILLHHTLTQQRIDKVVQGRDDTSIPESITKQLPYIADQVLSFLISRQVNLAELDIYSSPLKRAYEVAFALVEGITNMTKTLSKIKISSRLENIGLGSWEGKQKNEVLQDVHYQKMSSGSDFLIQAPDISSDRTLPESPYEVIKRAINIILEIVSQKRNTIIVGHKMSLIVPGVLLFAPNLMMEPDGYINWRTLSFPEGGFIYINSQKVIINETKFQ